jgi:hypothetical protein
MLLRIISGSAFAALCLTAAPASAQVRSTENASASGPVSARTAQQNPNRMVCVTEDVLGSRLGSKRHCMTAADWVAYRREIRNTVDRVQAMKIAKE